MQVLVFGSRLMVALYTLKVGVCDWIRISHTPEVSTLPLFSA